MGRSFRRIDDVVPNPACLLTKQPIRIENPVDANDALGHEILFDHLSNFGISYQDSTLRCDGSSDEVDIDLRDANDLLPLLQPFSLFQEAVGYEEPLMPSTRKAIEFVDQETPRSIWIDSDH